MQIERLKWRYASACVMSSMNREVNYVPCTIFCKLEIYTTYIHNFLNYKYTQHKYTPLDDYVTARHT